MAVQSTEHRVIGPLGVNVHLLAEWPGAGWVGSVVGRTGKDRGFLRQPIEVGCIRRWPEAENAAAVVNEASQLLRLHSERLTPGSLSNQQRFHIRRPGREARNAFELEPSLLKRRRSLAIRIV